LTSKACPDSHRRLEHPGHSVFELRIPLFGHGGECA
jgi:hypothetical protein